MNKFQSNAEKVVENKASDSWVCRLRHGVIVGTNHLRKAAKYHKRNAGMIALETQSRSVVGRGA